MWTAFQREVLNALGHEPLVLAPPTIADDPLVHALLRAAARDEQADDLAHILHALPALESLRRNPAAKRALWPQLRRLRRGTT
jgi:hypothetical protein